MNFKLFSEFSYNLFYSKIKINKNNSAETILKKEDKILEQFNKNLEIIHYPFLESILRIKNYQISNDSRETLNSLKQVEKEFVEKIIFFDRSSIFRYIKKN